MSREFPAHQDSAAKGLGHVLQAGHLVGGRADHRELQALRNPDVAEHDVSHVERQAEIDRRLSLARPLRVGLVLSPFRFMGGGQRRLATIPLVPVPEREDGEDRVADKPEDFPPMGEDGAGRAFEIGVEEVEKVLRRH